MEHLLQGGSDLLFSPRAIEQQLERIYLDEHFTESQILRKFLSFIVEETMLGRANCLKEYTIALGVLEKPAGFRPKENGIVRIHAGRLRRALQQYYSEKGHEDQIVITIPKGQYVPTFASRRDSSAGVAEFPESRNSTQWAVDIAGKLTLGVLPFTGVGSEESLPSFGDNLCIQLSSSLMQQDGVSVICYQAIRSAVEKNSDYRELNAVFGLSHVIAGGMQRYKDRIRVNLQIIECRTCRQIWSDTVEFGVSRSSVFEIQDGICDCAARGVGALDRRPSAEGKVTPMLSAI